MTKVTEMSLFASTRTSFLSSLSAARMVATVALSLLVAVSFAGVGLAQGALTATNHPPLTLNGSGSGSGGTGASVEIKNISSLPIKIWRIGTVAGTAGMRPTHVSTRDGGAFNTLPPSTTGHLHTTGWTYHGVTQMNFPDTTGIHQIPVDINVIVQPNSSIGLAYSFEGQGFTTRYASGAQTPWTHTTTDLEFILQGVAGSFSTNVGSPRHVGSFAPRCAAVQVWYDYDQIPGTHAEVAEAKTAGTGGKPTMGTNIVQAVVRNKGTVNLTNTPLPMEYRVNNGNWVAQTFTPTNLPSLTLETFSFSTPWEITVAGSYTLEVRLNPAVGQGTALQAATWQVYDIPIITPQFEDTFEISSALEQYGVLLGSRAAISRGSSGGSGSPNGLVLDSTESSSAFGNVVITDPTHRAVLDDPTQWESGGTPGLTTAQYIGICELLTKAPGARAVNVSFDLKIVREVSFGAPFENYAVNMVFEYSADEGQTWTHVIDPSSQQQGPTGVYRNITSNAFVPQAFTISGFSGDQNQRIRFRFRWMTRLKHNNGSINTYFGIDNFRLEVPFTITTSSLPSATATVPYEYEHGLVNLSQVSGMAPVSFSANPHPAWMNLNPSSGVITGVPTAADAGTQTITFTATDSNMDTATRQFPFTVKPAPSPVSITNLNVLPEASEGVVYTYNLSAFGGAPVPFGSSNPRYTWSIVNAQPSAAWISINADTGQLLGTPPAGSFGTTAEFSVRVKDNLRDLPAGTASNESTKPFFIHIVTQLSVMGGSIELAREGTTYRPMLQAAGGTPPYNWQIAEGVLPPGLSFQPATGRIIGVPLIGTGGSYPLTIQVFDSGVQSASFTTNLIVAPPEDTNSLAVITTELDPAVAIETQPFEAYLDAMQGVPPYTWSIPANSPDQLPPGLSIDGDFGRIYGSPFTGHARTYSLRIEVRDSRLDENLAPDPQFAFVDLELVLQGLIRQPKILTTQLQVAEVGFAYPPALPFPPLHINAPGLRVQDGVAPFEWTLVAGTLPPGLVFSEIGLIVGVPTIESDTTNDYPLTIRVSDALSNSDQVNLTLTVNAFSGAPLTVVSSSTLPAATEGAPYTFRITATGGANPTQSTLPYTFRRVSGGLPIGMDIDVFGQIRGTAAVGSAGTYEILVEVKDPAGNTQQTAMTLSVVQGIGGGGGGPTGNVVDSILSGSGSGCSIGGGASRDGVVLLLLLAGMGGLFLVSRRRLRGG